MAILKIPVVIDGVKNIEELANRVLDEYEYHGRTIREWADLISKIPPHGRLIDADDFDERIRQAGGMCEEELTEDFKDGVQTVLAMLKTQTTIIPAEEGE